MKEEDWHSVLYPLPMWRGWRIEGDGSFEQAHYQAFEPNPRKVIPSWECMQGSGEKRYSRTESKFDRELSDKGFQDWSVNAALEPYVWKWKLFSLTGDLTRQNRRESTNEQTAKYEGFTVNAKYPRAKIYILANRLGRLKTDCKAHLEEMRSSGSRGLLRAFLDRYGEWFVPTVVLGGHMSHFCSATTVTGQTMEEKEREIIGRISGSTAGFSWGFPFGRSNRSDSVNNQTIQVDRSSLKTLGGTQSSSVSIEEWEKSLDNPLKWDVIEREGPQPLFDVIARQPGWEWVHETINSIANSTPIPALLPPGRSNRYYSVDTSITSVVFLDRTLLFFQDHDGWIKWGAYLRDKTAELIFTESIVQAQHSTPIAGCVYKLPDENVGGSDQQDEEDEEDDESIVSDDESDQDPITTSQYAIHLFFVDKNGVVADQTSIITTAWPPSVAPWCPGTLETLELKIHPASKIAASCSTDGHSDVVVIFEQKHLVPGTSSHLFEAVYSRDKIWKVLSRPHQHPETATGGPLLVLHPMDTSDFTILYHSNVTGSLCLTKGDIDLELPYITQEVVPRSHIPADITANGYNGTTRVCFASNPYVSSEVFVAIRDDKNTVNVLSWQYEEDAGRTIKTLHRVCQTRPQTDFCLAYIRSRLMIFYIAADGQMEMAILNLNDSLVAPEKLPRWPIFMDSCKRHLLTRLVDEDEDLDS